MNSAAVLFRTNALRALLPPIMLVSTALVVGALILQIGASAAGSPTVPGIAVNRYGDDFPRATGYERYSYVTVSAHEAAAAGALATTSLVYMSGVTVQQGWSTGVTFDEALANDWLLRDSSGAYLRNVAYGGYMGDIGNPAYQQRFAQNVANLLQQNGNEGVFIDDVVRSPENMTGGRFPAKYPNLQSWEDALVSFMAAVGPYFKARGLYVLANASAFVPGDPQYSNAATTGPFWRRLAPHVSGVMCEYWMRTHNGVLRSSGSSDWVQWWDEWANLVNEAQNAGVDFFGLDEGTNSTVDVMRYGKATFLLNWDGSGGAYVYHMQDDPWNLEWTMEVGQPSGAKYQVGVGWRRDYSGGTALVNPSPSASQTFALGATYTRADGTAVTSVTLGPTTGLVLKSSGSPPPPPPPPPPPAPPTNTGLPTITGTAQQGSTLGASTGTWSGSPTAFAYQWKRCDTAGANCASIGGSTGQQYVLTAGDVGKRIRVTVTATNAGGSASATSNATGIVSSAPPPPPPPPPSAVAPINTAVPVISGAAEQGATLTASTGSWSNNPTGYAYQWKRCNSVGANCASIGASASSYTLGSDDVGSTLRVTVTASNTAGSGSATSNATPVIAPAPALKAPKIQVRPKLTGTPEQRQALTADTGTWSNSPRWYSFQWRRCNNGGGGCVDIAGATGPRYTVAASDAGRTLRVVVAASNSGGVSYARTDQTPVIPPRSEGPPEIVERPAIQGSAREGLVLTVTPGSWANEPEWYAFQWRRCDATGAACVSIEGANEAQRVVTAADVGWTLRVVVTASNDAGTTFARTDATAVVAPSPVAPPPTVPGK